MHRGRLSFMALLLVLPVAMAIASFRGAVAQDDTSTGLTSLPIFGTLEGEKGEQGTFQGSVSQLIASDDDEELSLGGIMNGLAYIGDDVVRITEQEFTSPVEPAVGGSTPAEEYTPTSDDDSADDGSDEEDSEEDSSGDSDSSSDEDSDEGSSDDAVDDGANEGGSGDEDAETPESDESAGLTLRAFSQQDNPTQPEPDPGKCDVLFLDIQPITLNLLGLELLTSRITLDLNAVPGEGNLLGNLVCALAGLLDGTPDAIGQITDQLNQVLSGAGIGSPELPPVEETAVSDPATQAPEETAVSDPATQAPVEETPVDATPVA